MNRHLLPASLVLLASCTLAGEIIDEKVYHLRSGQTREWDDFPDNAQATQLALDFPSRANAIEYCLRLRHRDLKQQWKVFINKKEIAKLPIDENPMTSLWPIPPRTLKEGQNNLTITGPASPNAPSDDIEVGDLSILDRPRAEVLSESIVNVEITDADTAKPLPCRLTIVDERGHLVPLGNVSDATTAARIGVLYTSDGKAALKLPAGRYTLYAGRGFEWSLASAAIDIKPSQTIIKNLTLKREVDTTGLVAADTHVHTFEYSRHGDSTLRERLITLAGEGVELSVATDHNLTIDYTTADNYAHCRNYFTPIIGNEVTTPKLGHFNVFPVPRGAPLMDFRAPTWEKLFTNIHSIAPGAVIILNHARDIHGGFRPFDPARHIATAGEDTDNTTLQANAMEVLNSSAIVTDPLLLYNDWMGCINGGMKLTPIGASDVHDVSRYIVGQGRTYVRCDDKEPGNIDVPSAVAAFRGGKVLVSYGLLTKLRVNGLSAGELVKPTGALEVDISVQGPAWTGVSTVQLFMNGQQIKTFNVPADGSQKPGEKFSTRLTLPKPGHDVFFTACAIGPGIKQMYWPCAKPYQPTSPRFAPYVLGASGAVFIDADASGAFNCASEIAKKIVAAAEIPSAVLKRLEQCDYATAIQVARVLRSSGQVKTPQELSRLAEQSIDPVSAGFKTYADAWRASAKE